MNRIMVYSLAWYHLKQGGQIFHLMPISMYIVSDCRQMFIQKVSSLEAFLSRGIIIQLILLCAGLTFINQAFSLYCSPLELLH